MGLLSRFDLAKRLAELAERGFNTDLPLYRGTTFDIGEEILANRALHVTDSPHYASAYAAGFDSPFDYHPGRQELRAAQMSREAHEALTQKAEQDYALQLEELKAAAEAYGAAGIDEQRLSRELWWSPEKDFFNPPPDYREELRRRMLPQSFDELIDMMPSDAEAARPGSNYLSVPEIRGLKDQMLKTLEELHNNKKARLAEMRARPESVRYREAEDTNRSLYAKLHAATDPSLSATPHVAPLFARTKNPKPMVDEMGIVDLHEDPDRVAFLKRRGYDSAIWTPEAETPEEVLEYFGNLKNNIHGGEMVVFDPLEDLTGLFVDYVPPRRR